MAYVQGCGSFISPLEGGIGSKFFSGSQTLEWEPFLGAYYEIWNLDNWDYCPMEIHFFPISRDSTSSALISW